MKFAPIKLLETKMIDKKNLRILFYGTPDFAAYSLKKIMEEGFSVVGVVTAPDKPSGRGLKLQSSPVKQVAQELSIEVLQPTNLKSEEFAVQLQRISPDVQVVIAFRMLPEVVWAFPKLGTFNLHASLLPQYRGAAPINHAIINGEKETGVTTFFIEKEIDTGEIILQSKVEISEDDNAGTLHDKLMTEGANVVVRTLQMIAENKVLTQAQTNNLSELKSAPKIFPKDCEINWNQSATAVRNFIRGMSPYPTAKTSFEGKLYKIFTSEIATEKPTLKPGEWLIENKQLWIGTTDHPLGIIEIQPEGKRRMSVKEFLAGYRGGVEF